MNEKEKKDTVTLDQFVAVVFGMCVGHAKAKGVSRVALHEALDEALSACSDPLAAFSAKSKLIDLLMKT